MTAVRSPPEPEDLQHQAKQDSAVAESIGRNSLDPRRKALVSLFPWTQDIVSQPVPGLSYATTARVPSCSLSDVPPRHIAAVAGKRTRVAIALPEDASKVSMYQQLIRLQLEFFASDQSDVNYSVQGRKKKAKLGQVGIRVAKVKTETHIESIAEVVEFTMAQIGTFAVSNVPEVLVLRREVQTVRTTDAS